MQLSSSPHFLLLSRSPANLTTLLCDASLAPLRMQLGVWSLVLCLTIDHRPLSSRGVVPRMVRCGVLFQLIKLLLAQASERTSQNLPPSLEFQGGGPLEVQTVSLLGHAGTSLLTRKQALDIPGSVTQEVLWSMRHMKAQTKAAS